MVRNYLMEGEIPSSLIKNASPCHLQPINRLNPELKAELHTICARDRENIPALLKFSCPCISPRGFVKMQIWIQQVQGVALGGGCWPVGHTLNVEDIGNLLPCKEAPFSFKVFPEMCPTFRNT